VIETAGSFVYSGSERTMGEKTIKLAQLRAKTDRQVSELICHRLEAGALLARNGWIAGAETAYNEAAKLLPLVRDPEKAPGLEARFRRLRDLLDEAAAGCARAACF
jgi:hypothetical protein